MEFAVRCPSPFIEEAAFPYTGGNLRGRWCKAVALAGGDDDDVSCCLPCPIEKWRYSQDFTLDMVSWIGVFALILAVVLLTSFLVLPVSATRSHYLTTSPLIGFIFMAISFIVPLAPSLDACYDAVTPNNWLSDNYCAISGSFLLYGVWVVVISCLFRSLSLYLHLCWETEPKTKFMHFALASIFLGSAALLLLALFVSGVAYQAGQVCNINIPRSRASFWGPLLGVSIASLLLQLLIIGHCIRRVLDPFGSRRNPLGFLFPCWTTGTRIGIGGAAAQVSASQVWARIWHILQLQWRAVAIVALVVFHVAFLCQALLRVGTAAEYSVEELAPWLACLITSKGDEGKDRCLSYAEGVGPSEGVTMAAWVLLSLFWGFACVARWSMVVGWVEWAREKRIAWRRGTTSDPVERDRLSDVERAVSTGETLYSPASATGKEKRWTGG